MNQNFIPKNIRRTKMVCTMGPATSHPDVLENMIQEGLDICRLNFSHGSHEEHQATLDKIRDINFRLQTNVGILVDLQGPKIRVGKLEEPYPVKPGDEVFLSTLHKEREGNILPMVYETFTQDVENGDMVLVDDGKVDLRVIETDKKHLVKLKVITGVAIGSKKGVNLPFTQISLPSITPKDWQDIEFAIKNQVEWIALSFVRTAEEVAELKAFLKKRNCISRVISKIEKPEALQNIDSIIQVSDAIMVARGDLGVEIPMEEVPFWQKNIIRKCNMAAKPVIVATQMMESMIENPRPTRAETNDVANAVLDGADALMLSGETSVGKFPVEVVRSMQKIMDSMEGEDQIYFRNMQVDKSSSTWVNDAVCISAVRLSQEIKASALVAMTRSGYTAFHLSRCRPKAPIYIFSDNRAILNQLNLLWGVTAFYYDGFVSTDVTIADLALYLKNKGLVSTGEFIVNTASMPMHARKLTNMVKITVVE
jgi:pyruvate kinase